MLLPSQLIGRFRQKVRKVVPGRAKRDSRANLRGRRHRTDAVQNELASLRNAGVWNRRIGSVTLVVSVVAVALALVAVATDSKDTRTYVSIAVAITVALSLAGILFYLAHVDSRPGELSFWSRSWRYAVASSLALTLGATLALTLSAEGQLNVGYTIHRTDTVATLTVDHTVNRGTTVNRTVTLKNTVSRTVTVNHTTNRTVKLNRTVYVTNKLPPTR
jgi:hypothetical protein